MERLEGDWKRMSSTDWEEEKWKRWRNETHELSTWLQQNRLFGCSGRHSGGARGENICRGGCADGRARESRDGHPAMDALWMACRVQC